MIVTPDQRLRVFISSTLEELADERAAIARAIESLRLTPVLFEIGARPHAPRDLYHAYLEQSHVFIGVYWQRYGWIAPGMEVSGLEEELALAREKPRLLYLKVPAPEREPRLTRMIERLQKEGGVSYRKFSSIDELSSLVTDDLAVLMSERFGQVSAVAPTEKTAQLADTPSPDTGLRAFLFTDVVESTARLTRQGDLKADVMRRQHFELLRSAVTSRGGREVKNLGDGLMVAFATVIDAVAAAVAIQRGVNRHNRRGRDDLQVRVGIQVGEATADHDDFFGRAVVEARRLCDAAAGGQILTSELVRSLSEARSPHAFHSMGIMPLKGLPDTAVYEILYEGTAEQQLPLPDAALKRGSPYVGRRLEQRRLRQLWEEAVAGHSAVAVVSGEPGIGKTRLTVEFAKTVHDEGALVLWGRSSEGLLLPYQPFLDMFRFYIAHTPPEVLREQFGASAEFLYKIVPEVAALFPHLEQANSRDPRGAREQLFDAASKLLSELTAATPALVVLDDVQWADEASLLLLKHLVRSPQDVAAFFVVTCRLTELGPDHPFTQLVADLSRDRLIHRLQLEGLDEPEAGSLFGSLVGFEPNPDLIHHVATGTRGNPYFLEEVAFQVSDRRLGSDDGIWGAETLEMLGVPAGVRAVSERRLERLTERTRDALAIAAIIGEEFDQEVLGAVIGHDGTDLIDVMDEAVNAGLLEERPDRIGSYAFPHALIRQTLLEGRSLNRKAVWHARVGDALEALHQSNLRPVLSDLAHHFSRAGHRCAAKAVRYGREAGEEALAMLAHEDAVSRFQESLSALNTSFTPDDANRAELLVLLGVALNRTGDVIAARSAFQEGAQLAKATQAAETLAKAAMGYGSVSGFGGVWYTYAVVDEPLVRLLEDALAAGSTGDEPTRALLLGSLAQALYWSTDSERMIRLSADALAMAHRLDDPAVLAHALDSRHVALWNPDTLLERTELANAMLRLAEEVGNRDLRLEAFSWLITDTLESGPFELVAKYIDAHARLAEELRQPYHLWYTAAVKAMWAFQRGDYEAADRLVEEAWKHGQQAHGANAEQTYLVQKLFVGREVDRLAPMVPGLAAYVEHTPLVYGWRCALAFAYAETGQRAEAISQLELLAADDFARIRRDCIWLATLSMLAQVIVRFELTEHAGTLYRLLQPYEGRRIVVGGSVLCFGPVSRVLGALARVEGRFDEALGHLDRALAEAREDDTPPIQARVQLEIATVLHRQMHQGNELLTASLLDEAESTASKLGMTSLLRDIATQRNEMVSARPALASNNPSGKG